VTAITTGHDSARIGVGGWVVPAAGAGSGSARIAATGAAGSSRLMRPGHPCGTRHRKDSSLGDKIGDHGEHRRCALYRERGSIRMTFTVNAAHAAAQAPAPVVFALASVRKILAVPRIGTCDRHVARPDDGESHAMRVHLVRHETRRWRDVPGSGASHPTRVSVRCSPCSEACETRRCCLSLERPSGLQKEACLADVNILEPSDRRRIWSAQEKAALLAEIDAEGGKVRLVARRLTGIAEKLWIGVASVYRVLADDAAGAVVVQPSR
jgi:hypothetical protein